MLPADRADLDSDVVLRQNLIADAIKEHHR